MAYIDIILLALIAIFLVLRLRSVLGERNGKERPPQNSHFVEKEASTNDIDANDSNKIISLNVKKRQKINSHPTKVTSKEDLSKFCSKEAEVDILALKQKYKDFSVESFMHGSEAAFNMILTAYASENLPMLKKLLTPTMCKNFQESLLEIKKNKKSLYFTLVRVEGKITHVKLSGKKATIEICFNSEQVNVVRDSKGSILEGDPKTGELCEDIWVFEKDMSRKSPIWLLTETK